MDDSLMRIVKSRKRTRENCPSLSTGGWLQNKRVCLLGDFSLYRRESVVDALRAEGAHVYIHPPSQHCDVLVVGEDSPTLPPPPYLRENQLQQPHLWIWRFDITLPWYQQFSPQKSTQLLGRKSEVTQLRRWLHGWKQSKSKPGLILYGGSGYGKKTLLQCVLADMGFKVLDFCSATDKLHGVCNSIQASGSLIPGGNNPCAIVCYISELTAEGKKRVSLGTNRGTPRNNGRKPCGGLYSANDFEAVCRLLRFRIVPVFFVVSERIFNKKSALWSSLQSQCELMRVDPLSSPTILSILLRLSACISVESTEKQLQVVAERCQGDVRQALVSLECGVRFGQLQMGHQLFDSLDRLLQLSTAPRVSLQKKMSLLARQDHDSCVQLEWALYNCVERCSMTGLADFCGAFSDCDLFYPGEEYRVQTLLSFAAPHLKSTSIAPYSAAPRQPKAAAALLRNSPARRLFSLSASDYSLELLSAYPDLLRQTTLQKRGVPSLLSAEVPPDLESPDILHSFRLLTH